MLFFSTADRLRELPLDKLRRATLIKVKFEDMKAWSDLVAPQGVIGEGHVLKYIQDECARAVADLDRFTLQLYFLGPILWK